MADYTLTFGSDVVTSYTEVTNNAQSAMGASAVEDRIGEAAFNGSNHSSITFECLVTPTFATTGTVSLRLYDVGPVSGPPTVGRLVATLATTTTGGPQRLTQTLAAVASGPGTNEILNTDRMYQVTAEVDATTGDDCYIGWVSLVGVGGGSVAITSDPTAIHKNIDAEISAISAKGTPTSSDFLLIEDAADSNSKKSITIGDLPSGGGGTSDGRAFTVVIGNSLEGDTTDVCDYLDVGDGVQLKAGIEASAGKDVFVRKGTYDFNTGAATDCYIQVPIDTRVIGAGRDQTIVRGLSAGTETALLHLVAGSFVESIKFLIPTPTANAAMPAWGSYVLAEAASGERYGLKNVTFEFEDAGWSTLADNSWVNAWTVVGINASAAGAYFTIEGCSLLNVPNYESTPVAEAAEIQGIYSGWNDTVLVSDINLTGSSIGLQLGSIRGVVTNSIVTGSTYVGIHAGSPGSVSNNVVEITADSSWGTQIGILVGWDVSVIGNACYLEGTTHGSTNAIVLNGSGALASGNYYGGSEYWEWGVDSGANAVVITGNNFPLSKNGYHLEVELHELVSVGNAPGVNPQVEFHGLESNLWGYTPGLDTTGFSEPMKSRVDFNGDTSVTNAWDITGNVAGSLSADTVDVFDTTFNTGTVVRYTQSPLTRRSWCFFQAPANGKEFIVSGSLPTPGTNGQVIARLKFMQRLTPIAGDARVGYMLGKWTLGPAFDVNNYMTIVLSDTTGGNLVATFQKVDSGVPSTIGSTANVGAQGQALEHIGFHLDGVGAYHGFVGTTGGNWIYLGSTTMTVAPTEGGVYLQNNSVAAPGVAVAGIDFVRSYVTSNFLF